MCIKMQEWAECQHSEMLSPPHMNSITPGSNDWQDYCAKWKFRILKFLFHLGQVDDAGILSPPSLNGALER